MLAATARGLPVGPKGANSDGYEPILTASTRSLGDKVEIKIRDNATGFSPIRNRAFVQEKYYLLAGLHEVKLPNSKGHFGAGHLNINAVLEEVERLGIPRMV